MVIAVGVVLILKEARAPFSDTRANAVVTFLLWLTPIPPAVLTLLISDRVVPSNRDGERPRLAVIGELLALFVLSVAPVAAIVALFTIIFGAFDYWG